MRVSSDRDDPGYVSHDGLRRALVIRCDGNVISKVIMADTDEGLVRYYPVDGSGEIVIDRGAGETVIAESRGVVTITLP